MFRELIIIIRRRTIITITTTIMAHIMCMCHTVYAAYLICNNPACGVRGAQDGVGQRSSGKHGVNMSPSCAPRHTYVVYFIICGIK